MNKLQHLVSAQEHRRAHFDDSEEGSLITAVVDFFGSENLELSSLRQGLIDNQTRGYLRLTGFKTISTLTEKLKDEDALIQVIRHLALAFGQKKISGEGSESKAAEGMNDDVFNPSSILESLESVSSNIKDNIVGSYMEIAAKLLTIVKNDNNNRIEAVDNRPAPEVMFPAKSYFLTNSHTLESKSQGDSVSAAAVQSTAVSNSEFALTVSPSSTVALVNPAGYPLAAGFSVEAFVKYDELKAKAIENPLLSCMTEVEEKAGDAQASGSGGGASADTFYVLHGSAIDIYDSDYKMTRSVSTQGEVRGLVQLPDGRWVAATQSNIGQTFTEDFSPSAGAFQLGGGATWAVLVPPNKIAFCYSSNVSVHDINTYAKLYDLTDAGSTLRFCDALPDGTIVTGSYDNTVRIYAPDATSVTRTYTGHSNDVNCICVLPDGKIVTGSDDQTAHIIDISGSTTQMVHTLRGHSSRVWTVRAFAEVCLYI